MDIIIFAVFTLLSFSCLALAYIFGRPHEYFFLITAGTLFIMSGIQLIADGLTVTLANTAATVLTYNDVYITGLGTIYILFAVYSVLGLVWGMRGKEANVIN